MGSTAAFEIPIRPRYGEVDSMGVVYHAHYLAYFDVGRTEYLRAAGASYAELERRGFRLPVVELSVRYLRSARYDEELRLAVELAQVGRASVRFRYVLRRGAETLATGETRLGCLAADNRPTPLPPDTLACLQRAAAAARGNPGSSPGV